MKKRIVSLLLVLCLALTLLPTVALAAESVDLNGDGVCDTDDAVHLLLHVMFGAQDYPVPAGTNLDFTNNGETNTNDAVYLLLHIMFSDADYPLYPETPAESTMQPITYTLSFAGDCTLGDDYSVYGAAGRFTTIVGSNYSYPFENAMPYFGQDDFTLVNLEGVLSGPLPPAEKKYRFRGPVDYAKILTAGSVDAVNLANNHTYDFGTTGYKNTLNALEAENITYVEDAGTATFTTESGLKLGLFSGQFTVDLADMKKDIQQLRDDGAEIVIASFHWGIERSYTPTSDQKKVAHAAIDAGADIVVGHHPHVLQPVEEYKNGVIYYSLGNFSFGGNRNPSDKDSVVVQQLVIREANGTVHLGETKLIPFRVSSVTNRNDYKPTPYAVDSADYKRAMRKLNGTYK